MTTPSNLKYTITDEWIRLEGNTATIGVTDYAQDSLSDIVFFEAVVAIARPSSPRGLRHNPSRLS